MSMGILMEEKWINKTENYSMGDSGVYESYFKSPGDVYRFCLKEYGRCVSKVYVDRNGKSVHVGWAFEKQDRYEDTKEPYIKETWVALHEKMPVTRREEFLMEVK